MCFIVFEWQPEERRLTLASNRDEFYARPTSPAHFWADRDHPDLLAGRDERGGGTWMGVTRDGRWAALTNVREPDRHTSDAPSRGDLVADFLQGDALPEAYARAVAERGARYNGFNLLLGYLDEAAPSLWYVSNCVAEPRRLRAGRYGLSNAALDTPWPKVVRGKAYLARAVDTQTGPIAEALLAALADDTQAPDDALPDTGVGLDWERRLSPIHIASEAYGTRAATVLHVSSGQVAFTEQTYAATGPVGAPRHFGFALRANGRTTPTE
ncbi:MAG: NRDE family protein [Bacteroidota bacterium]